MITSEPHFYFTHEYQGLGRLVSKPTSHSIPNQLSNGYRVVGIKDDHLLVEMPSNRHKPAIVAVSKHDLPAVFKAGVDENGIVQQRCILGREGTAGMNLRLMPENSEIYQNYLSNQDVFKNGKKIKIAGASDLNAGDLVLVERGVEQIYLGCFNAVNFPIKYESSRIIDNGEPFEIVSSSPARKVYAFTDNRGFIFLRAKNPVLKVVTPVSKDNILSESAALEIIRNTQWADSYLNYVHDSLKFFGNMPDKFLKCKGLKVRFIPISEDELVNSIEMSDKGVLSHKTSQLINAKCIARSWIPRGGKQEYIMQFHNSSLVVIDHNITELRHIRPENRENIMRSFCPTLIQNLNLYKLELDAIIDNNK